MFSSPSIGSQPGLGPSSGLGTKFRNRKIRRVGEDRAPGRDRDHRLGEGAVEAQAARGESVDVGRLDLRRAIGADVVRPQAVDDQDDDVRPAVAASGGVRAHQRRAAVRRRQPPRRRPATAAESGSGASPSPPQGSWPIALEIPTTTLPTPGPGTARLDALDRLLRAPVRPSQLPAPGIARRLRERCRLRCPSGSGSRAAP